MTPEIFGTTAPGFARLAQAFAAGFEGHPEMGAALHVRIGGRVVADLWGGIADARTGRPWAENTPTVVFSCTKGLMSILVARAVEAGLFSYDTPVHTLWPEFSAAGKEGVTVGQALGHRAGLSAPREDVSEDDLLDWIRMVSILGAQEPLWPPGTGYAYHALTHGWLAGEILRRATGQMPGQLLQDSIAAPLGVDAWIGLPDSIAPLVARSQVSPALTQIWAEEAVKPAPNWPYKAMTLGHALPADLVTQDGGFNAPHIRAAQIPGAGGIATARALGSIWSACVVPTNGVRLLEDATIDKAIVTMSEGPSVFGGDPPFCRWGMGFQLDSPARKYLSDQSFGHDGAGGQSGFADRAAGVGFGYVTNWMIGPEDTRAASLTDVLRDLV